ncbi:ABC transporter permease [Pseudomarimonas arenosa]|uniref:ABC transporter permease n=1 Tax=Pseudomarimonas arenosa TaxID=2774145 RepID=A0AAW3ZVH7_9GAMM|nr:ABC transporter permease [Pseudomarimonas arenosa]MBD8528066.1 ABC transporter permease [Pseudomarimonas arenosa]
MNMLFDLRAALRSLSKSPLFVLLACSSLALGIGVNAAIFSLFDQIMLRPLPVAQPEQLVNLVSPGPRWGSTSNNNAGSRESIFSYPMYRDLRALDAGWQGLAAHRSIDANLALGQLSRSSNAALVSDNYFSLLGLQPALGRLIGSGDEGAPGQQPVAVLAHGFWQNQLGGDPALLGQSIKVNGRDLTIVGVAPPGFRGTTLGDPIDLFAPISLADWLQPNRRPALAERNNYWVYLFARLAPGQTIDTLAGGLQSRYQTLLREVELPVQDHLNQQQQAEFVAKSLLLRDGRFGQSSVRDSSQVGVSILLAVASLVLLVACLNVANLQLARGTQRAGQIALRAAIGAGRWRLLRELLAESILLAVLGALIALPVAQALLSFLAELLPAGANAALSFTLDYRLIGFALLVALLSVLLFGALPAWQVARTAPMDVLRQAATHSAHPVAVRFRTALAVLQIGLSTASLIMAGLFSQSLNNIFSSDSGMQIERVISFSLAPQRNGYSAEQSLQLFDQLEARLAELPGVESATTSLVPLLSGSDWGTNVSVQGFPNDDPDQNHSLYNQVGADYFRTLSIRRLAGRDFEHADSADRPKVAIVNRAFAEQFGLGDQAVGKRMALGETQDLDMEIVGVVETTSYNDVTQRDQPQFFLPRRQGSGSSALNFLIKTQGPVEPLQQAIPAIIAEIDRSLPLQQVSTLEQDMRDHHSLQALVGTLSSGFALLATVLAALGVYGVVNYSLQQRLREFGLRLALGAPPARLRAQILNQVLRLFAGGAAIGLLLGVLSGRSAESLLFGLSGSDPLTLLIAPALLALIVILATWRPAWRAGQVDPMQALRYE